MAEPVHVLAGRGDCADEAAFVEKCLHALEAFEEGENLGEQRAGETEKFVVVAHAALIFTDDFEQSELGAWRQLCPV